MRKSIYSLDKEKKGYILVMVTVIIWRFDIA